MTKDGNMTKDGMTKKELITGCNIKLEDFGFQNLPERITDFEFKVTSREGTHPIATVTLECYLYTQSLVKSTKKYTLVEIEDAP